MPTISRNQRATISPTFKRHLLTGVLARLDFQPIIEFEPVATELGRDVNASFPIIRVNNDLDYSIDATTPESPKFSAINKNVVYEFADDSRRASLKLGRTALILEHYKYISFDKFSAEFLAAAKFIGQNKKVLLKPTKLGLRKINSILLPEIESTTQGFKDFFIDELCSHLRLPLFEKVIFEDRHRMTSILDGNTFIFQFGTDLGEVNSIRKRRFIIDIDLISNAPGSDIAQVSETLTKLNEAIFDIFWWSLGPKGRDYLVSEETV